MAPRTRRLHALTNVKRLFARSPGPLSPAPAAFRNGDCAAAAVGPTDGIIAYTSARWDTLFGYDDGELTGRHISAVNLPADDQAPGDRLHSIVAGLERDGAWQGEMRNLRKDRSDFHGVTSITRFDDEQRGRMWLVVVTPVD